MGLTKILDGSVEQGSVTIENPEISVAIDAGEDSIKVGSQVDGASGTFNQDPVTAVDPSWGSPIAFGFETQGIMFQNRGNELVEVSFDGVNKAIDLNAQGLFGADKSRDNEHRIQFWLRSASGSVVVHVEAW